jgi:hypothetical protein
MFIPQLLMGDGYLVAEMDCLLRERLLEKGLRTVCLLDWFLMGWSDYDANLEKLSLDET